MDMKLHQTLDVSLRQEQQLHARQLQSLEILALPITELRQHIQEEIEKNPVLEMSYLSGHNDENRYFYESYEAILNKKTNQITYTASNDVGGVVNPIEYQADYTPSLTDYLQSQLRFLNLTKHEYSIGMLLIDNLDDNGFYINPPYEHLDSYPAATVQKMISLIQQFEPLGVCVANAKASLILQSQIREDIPVVVTQVLESPALYSLLENNQLEALGQKLRYSNEQVDEIIQHIKTLTPYPGRQYSHREEVVLVPDAYVLFKEDVFKVGVYQHSFEKLKINEQFINIIEEKGQTESKKFARSYVADGKQFIRSLDRRRATLVRTIYALLEWQSEYFKYGNAYLKPLNLRTIATMLDLHESTISRISHKKLLQTNTGIIPISFLFSNRVSKYSAEQYSKVMVQEKIKQIILSHPHEEKKLSDIMVMRKLSQQGIFIARRTVNKYRNQLRLISGLR